MYDVEFGAKLAEIESAVGFRFPATDFQNLFLASLLETTPETMSRKKAGLRRVTEWDLSKLTSYFDLARYGVEPHAFALGIGEFSRMMREVGRKAQAEAKPNKARHDLLTLAGGRLQIVLANPQRGGGIGADPMVSALPRFRPGDFVKVKVSVPGDGHLYLLNDGRNDISCLMPSYFAPLTAVQAGTVTIPTTAEFPRFPIGGPVGTYRLFGLWFAEKPQLSLGRDEGSDRPPRDIEHSEFIEIAECAVRAKAAEKAVMVAFGDYRVD